MNAQDEPEYIKLLEDAVADAKTRKEEAATNITEVSNKIVETQGKIGRLESELLSMKENLNFSNVESEDEVTITTNVPRSATSSTKRKNKKRNSVELQ